MTRNLRKRHVFFWLFLAVVLTVLMVLGRSKTPVFKGDENQTVIDSNR